MSDGPGSGGTPYGPDGSKRGKRAPGDARWVAWGRRERLGQSTAEGKGPTRGRPDHERRTGVREGAGYSQGSKRCEALRVATSDVGR